MQITRKIHLLIPDLLWPVVDDRLKKVQNRPRFIEKLLTRAKRQKFDGADLEQTLFHLFDVFSDKDYDPPVGAVAYVGDGGNPAGYCWARATPVHLFADGDHLITLGPEHLEILQSEAESLVSLFNSHFAKDELSLVIKHLESWYLKLPTCLNVKTYQIESVVGHPIEEYLPLGIDRSRLQNLLNEIQMLFYQCDVNEKRRTGGGNVINGIWFSGFGQVPSLNTNFDAIFSSIPFAKGLAKLSNTDHYEFNGRLPEINNSLKNIIIVFSDFMESKRFFDIAKWQHSLIELNKSLSSCLRNEWKKSELVIYNCRGLRFDVDRSRFMSGFLKRTKAFQSHDW